MPEFRRTKIRLPRSSYIGQSWYFVTICTGGRETWLGDAKIVEDLRKLLKESAASNDFEVVAYCFMPDHLHILVRGLKNESSLAVFIKSFKQQSAYRFKRERGNILWQRYFYDHALRNEDRWEEVAHYIWMNPVRKGLARAPENWPNSGSQTIDWLQIFSLGCKPWVPPWRHAKASLLGS